MGDFSAPGMQGFDRDDSYRSTLNVDRDKTLVMPVVPKHESKFHAEVTADVWETQVGGQHYKKYAIQPTEYIVKNRLNFVEGNIIKYVTRYRDKGGLEDLKKARHYLDILISEVEQEDFAARRDV